MRNTFKFLKTEMTFNFVKDVVWKICAFNRNIPSDLTHLMNEGLIYDKWVNFIHDNDANMYEDLVEDQNDILYVIKL